MDQGKNVELVSRSREREGGRLKTLCREREGGRWYAIATYEQFLKNCQFSVFHLHPSPVSDVSPKQHGIALEKLR